MDEFAKRLRYSSANNPTPIYTVIPTDRRLRVQKFLVLLLTFLTTKKDQGKQ